MARAQKTKTKNEKENGCSRFASIGFARASPARASPAFSSARSSALRHFVFLFITASLFLIPSIHAAAAWQPAVFAAVLISVSVLAVVYMIVTVLKWDRFKGIIKDELGQTFITFLLVVLLVAGMSEGETQASKLVCGISGMPDSGFCPTPARDTMIFCKTAGSNPTTCPITGSQPLNNWALSLNTNAQSLLSTNLLAKALEFNQKLGYVSSVSGFCNMLGVGFSIAGCSTYGVLRGPVGQLLNAIGIGLMDLQAERILLQLNTAGFTLSLLLPLGILLRALHWTRKAGGTLIALALSLYFIFPASLLLGQAMADQFIKTGSPYQALAAGPTFPAMSGSYNPLDTSTVECNPFDPSTGKMVNTMNSFLTRSPSDPANVKNPSTIDQILFVVMIRNLMITIVALTVTLSATRVLGHALGAEIDVWGIARLS